jgi:RsiW-degrading membrane proteinase PrsW (M82 family)
MSIASFSGSILVLLGGLGCALVLLILTLIPTTGTLSADQRFGGIVQFTAFAVAGIVGGAFGFYHSFRSLFLKKPSAEFKLPWFWLFLVLYMLLIALGAVLYSHGQSVANIPLTTTLIALAGILPALTILALGVRRVHFPRKAPWPTSWRRFTLALVSGATLAIVLAAVFELILTALAVRGLGVNGFSIDNPDQPIPNDPRVILLMFIVVSVIAPVVEETVKPLAVVIMIGRIRSAGEAFVLGLAAGIGFDLIETAGYISMGYRDWLSVALERSAAGLLHGFGAAMVTLGWYYLTHPNESKHRFLLAFGCWAYAILQHALWNGSFGLQLLPAPIGPYLDTGTITISSLSIPSFILVYVVEAALMLIFFLYVTGKVRGKTTTGASSQEHLEWFPNRAGTPCQEGGGSHATDD